MIHLFFVASNEDTLCFFWAFKERELVFMYKIIKIKTKSLECIECTIRSKANKERQTRGRFFVDIQTLKFESCLMSFTPFKRPLMPKGLS